jgi:hypothetical protein
MWVTRTLGGEGRGIYTLVNGQRSKLALRILKRQL